VATGARLPISTWIKKEAVFRELAKLKKVLTVG
jgi:hypothetical protein